MLPLLDQSVEIALNSVMAMGTLSSWTKRFTSGVLLKKSRSALLGCMPATPMVESESTVLVEAPAALARFARFATRLIAESCETIIGRFRRDGHCTRDGHFTEEARFRRNGRFRRDGHLFIGRFK